MNDKPNHHNLNDEMREQLSQRTIVLVGLMGAGKTTVGRRLANALAMPFKDADHEIEQSAGLTVSEIFDRYGEDHFRDGERKVIARLVEGEPCVLATGGGAFMNDETRGLIQDKAISVWLKAEVELLFERVMRRDTRPLLRTGDPRDILERLMAERYPVYAKADVGVESGEGPHAKVVANVVDALVEYLNLADNRS